MNELLAKLSGGDLRSEGRAAEVAAEVIHDPALLGDLVEGLSLDDDLIRARTCMSLEVLSRSRPDLLKPLGGRLIRASEAETVAQARWHLAEIFCRVELDRDEAERVVGHLLDWLGDKSRIVGTCAVMALGVVGRESPRRSEIADAIRPLGEKGGKVAKVVAAALRDLDSATP